MIVVYYRRIRDRFRLRALEWEHAIITSLFGAALIWSPGLIENPSFAVFRPIGGELFGWVIFVLGLCRIVALGINGLLPRPTALARSLSAVLGIVLFSTIGLGFLLSGTGTTGIGVYLTLAVFGCWSLYWAVFDVAVPDRHDH